MDLTWEELTYIINHVFLPLKLPHEYNCTSPMKDAVMLNYVARTAQCFHDKLEESEREDKQYVLPKWKTIIKLLDNFARVHQQQYLVEVEVETVLEGMQIHDVVPLYIESQNAAVIFRKTSEGLLTFEYFEVSLPAEEVMKECNKIVVRYPANPRLLVATSDDVAPTLANLLSFFSSNAIEDAIPKTRKGGHSHDETRDTASPRYISEALAGIIRATQPSDDGDAPTTFVTKRLADHVLWRSAEKPWRRSPLWLVLRVSLQTTLAEWGLEDGHGYKAFQAFLMASILRDAVALYPKRLTADLLYFANAKLGRRLAKMGGCVEDATNLTLREAGSAVLEISSFLKQWWQKVTTDWEERVQWTAPRPEAFEGCTELTFQNSQSYLRQVIQRQQLLSQKVDSFSKEATEQQLRSNCTARAPYTSRELPSDISQQDIDTSLFDFENWVAVHLPHWIGSPSRSEKDCLSLSALIAHYREIASTHYKDDPERLSLMHLCVLELWVALDRLVVKWCSLLREFSPEIPEDLLDPLLLPYLDQAKRLQMVQEYIKDRHRRAAECGNISLFREINSSKSFASRFFDLSLAEPLHRLQRRIETWATERRNSKIRELESLNKRHTSLMKQAEGLNCNYVQISHRKNGVEKVETVHQPGHCKKCQVLNTANGLRIKPIEEPLPTNKEAARFIIFELMCPQPFAIWRDTVIALLVNDIPPEKEKKGKRKGKRKGKKGIFPISQYNTLSQFCQAAYSGQRVKAASSAKSISASHYGKGLNLPKNETHVILKCAGNFSLYDSTSNQWIQDFSHPNWAQQFTLQLDGPYRSIQNYLDTTCHAPNQVIASQSHCPTGISIDEYITFGHLRAGHQLQWRNILRALRTQSLTFSESSVYFLIVQAIWQAGTMGDDGPYREAHVDLADELFCTQALHELQASVQLAGENWTQTLFLGSIVTLVLRIHNFAHSRVLKDRALDILSQARAVAFKWISTIQGLKAKEVQMHNQSRHALIGAALVLRATFDLEGREEVKVSFTGQNIIWYLFSGTLIAEIIVSTLPAGLRFLASRDRRTSLRLQSNVASILQSNPNILSSVIALRWGSYRQGGPWNRLASPAERWWRSSTTAEFGRATRTVHLNLVNGSLLIDGKPFDHLPENYKLHPTYKALFQSEEIENVCLSTMKGMEYEGSYHGHEVHFSLVGKNLIIRCCEGVHIEEFIPSLTLKGDIPSHLIDGYHYWYMEDFGCLEVRPDSQTWIRNQPRSWKALLNMNGTSVSGEMRRNVASTSYHLVDPHSLLYYHLSKTLRPLESQKDAILVTVEDENASNGTLVYLPRHDLNFRLTASNLLECQSFPGFVLDDNYHGIGCLIGLQSIISLRLGDSVAPQHKIIVPKGSFKAEKGPHGHSITSILLQDVGGYFAYDVDCLLGRLNGSRSIESDLFLIQLHAFTSSPLSDELTQRSGTDEALDYLSNSCFSSYTISSEAKSYLDTLTSFTPTRTFYPTHLKVMETVDWHPTLPTLSQNPRFRPMVEAILDHWRVMDQFHDLEDILVPSVLPVGMAHLSMRADAQNWIFYRTIGLKHTLEDLIYEPRDCLLRDASKERERLSFQVARLCRPSVSAFPLSQSLRTTVIEWNNISDQDSYIWDRVNLWWSTDLSLKRIWPAVYEFCRRARWPSSFQVTTTLGLLGYRELSFEMLATLVAITRLSESTRSALICPISRDLNLSEGYIFDPQWLERVLRNHAISFKYSDESRIERPPNETKKQWRKRTRSLYERELRQELDESIAELRSQWLELPPQLQLGRKRLLPLDSCLAELRSILVPWSRNWAFLDHIDQVCRAIDPMYASTVAPCLYIPSPRLPLKSTFRWATPNLTILMHSTDPPSSCHAPSSLFPTRTYTQKTRVDTSKLEHLLSRLNRWCQNTLETVYLQNLSDSIKALASSDQPADLSALLPTFDTLHMFEQNMQQIYDNDIKIIRTSLITSTFTDTVKEAAGMAPMITPVVLLKHLSFEKRADLPIAWRKRLIHFAVIVQLRQWARRMLRLFHRNKPHLLSLEVQHGRQWNPEDHPDWLLIEIDADISIRPNQADMAMEMMRPPKGQNSVMQLNMGEGKSSVIVPIVSVSAVDSSCALSRVIVPRSQMRQQFHILRQTITNLSGRQIFHLPFKRDLELGKESAQKIHNFLNMAAQRGSVWLCEPEQLLSLKLLSLDRSLRDNALGLGGNIIKIQTWLHKNARDIIDESDEVLNPKQQVIYTVGQQVAMDAAPLRWEVHQSLLDLLVKYFGQLEGTSSTFVLKSPKHIGGFPGLLRFNSNKCGQIVYDFMVRSIRDNEWSIRSNLLDLSVQFVTMQAFPVEVYQALQRHCPEPQSRTMDTLLILRGMLQMNILQHIFKDKRYRVNYGLDLKRSLLAVPYRAKDLPSPRSEFGHPDVTIILTCLSYYYGGLDKEMIWQTLRHLPRSSTPDLTYAEWLKPCWNEIARHLRNLNGINMHDERQLENQLFPFLKFNKRFIDSYLNWIVFPRQAKEFPSKLSSSGWDLALPKNHVTTGFSGTNDGRFLLPITITQLDRPAQLHTNAKVLSCLLQDENRLVHPYSDDGDSSTLLKQALQLEPKPAVILDVGAQVLDRSNLEFSKLWLSYYKDNSTIKAVIFFEGDELMVLTPDGVAQPLLDSPYSGRLDQCLVYLDDAHTRGTDLRLPDVTALVTLGPKLTKDKLVQGCMRMRKLGQGQNVTFFASNRIMHLIAKASGCSIDKVTSQEVLIWTIKETWKQLYSNLPAYMVQGHSFVKREAEWKGFTLGRISHVQLAKRLCEQESRTLKQLYGPDASGEHSWIWEYHSPNAVDQVSLSIYQRCKEFGSFSLGDTNLYEEKEIELVHEKEIERVVERPPNAKAALHRLDQEVTQFILTGVIPGSSKSFSPANHAFRYTSIRPPGGSEKTWDSLFVTEDFCRTIDLGTLGNMDNFMRPVEWLVTPIAHSFAVALSPFEVNKLFKAIKNSRKVLLYVFSPRNNLSMRSFETFDSFTLPISPASLSAFPRQLIHQINLFSGSIFIRDYRTYRDICNLLQLHFDDIGSEASTSTSMANPSSSSDIIIDATFFVVDQGTRIMLGMQEAGFEESPVPFLRKLLITRRHGQALGPSHMGKLLQGVKLKEEDFISLE